MNKVLKWSENYPPNDFCCYDHCFAETPFGRFLLTWKSWKDSWNNGMGFDETPFEDGVWYDSWDSIEEAQGAAEQRFVETMKELLGQ